MPSKALKQQHLGSSVGPEKDYIYSSYYVQFDSSV